MIRSGQQLTHLAAVPLARRILFGVRMGRPKFLIGGLLLHCLGVAMALAWGASLRLPALLWGQAAVTSIQLMAHYCNDYFDLAADRANPTPTDWSGGSRILPEGSLEPRVALWIAVGLGVLALLLALVLALAIRPGALTFLLIAAALLLAWSYSAPPLKLHSRGLGVPLAAWQSRHMLWGAWADPALWNSLGFWAVALLMGTTAAELLAFLLLAAQGQ
jgi:1,4-dihydroxy-2-naphthoate octaprenyltransferase